MNSKEEIKEKGLNLFSNSLSTCEEFKGALFDCLKQNESSLKENERFSKRLDIYNLKLF